MRLKPVLDVDAVDDAFRSEISASEEEREDGLRDKAVVVGGPQHCRERCGIGLGC